MTLAGAVNAITSGPNRSEAIHTKDFTGRVSRGGGRDVRAGPFPILKKGTYVIGTPDLPIPRK